ncbi:MAG: FkbM family methyltransferase [Bacteroidota bacterium]
MVKISNLVVFFKKSFKLFAHFFGVELSGYNIYSSEDLLLQTILKHFKITTVIDVGANEGQYALGLISNGFKGKIFSFEPIAIIFHKLSKAAERHNGWSTFNLGIGEKEDEISINVSENFVSSSILEINQTSIAAESKSRFTHQERIRMTSLDSFFANVNIIHEDTLLKLDIQGFELNALRGAKKSLPWIKVIQIELSFVQLYKGSPLFQEVTDFLKKEGFEIFTIIPGFRNAQTGQMLQADGIFVRS